MKTQSESRYQNELVFINSDVNNNKMFKRTDSKQKTLTDFLSSTKKSLQTKSPPSPRKEQDLINKNAHKRSLRSGTVYLESSSSDEENVNATIIGSSQMREKCSSGSFIPSPRNYKFSSIDDIIKEDKNYQNALNKIKKNLGEPSNIKRIIENSTFLDDSISPIKSQKAESKLLAKYMSESSRKEDTSQSNNDKTVFGECLFYQCGAWIR